MILPSLTVADLFTPSPSGVGPFGVVPAAPPGSTWLGKMLTVASLVQLPTTSWEPGAPERTILAIEAVEFSTSDVNISLMAQGAFLQSAASGSVTYQAVDGSNITVAVTPDPSNAAQNPSGTPGWLDLLSQGEYQVARIAASYATGPLAIVNLRPSTVGPYAPGSYHVANAVTGATYSNPAALTVPSSALPGSTGQVAGVAAGLTATTITTATPHGLSVGQVIYVAIPSSSGVSGLDGVFALVLNASMYVIQIGLSASGTWTAGGTIYLCTVATMAADATGLAGNASPGAVNVGVTQNANVFVHNVQAWSGANWESNAGLVSRCLLSLANSSPNGPAQAYEYVAETAVQTLAVATPPYALTNGPVSATTYSNPQTAVVTTVLASASPASSVLGANITPGCAQNAITGLTNSNPCEIQCAAPTGLSTGQTMTVTIAGVQGTLGVNGVWLASYVSGGVFTIQFDSTIAGAYTYGGTVEGGDLGQIDALLQSSCVPDGITAITLSALALPIDVAATVVVPQAYVTAYRLAAGVQIAAQFASYPVGGPPSSVPEYSVAWDDLLGALEEAGVVALGQATYVKAVQSLVVSGDSQVSFVSGTGIAFPSGQYRAIPASFALQIVGV